MTEQEYKELCEIRDGAPDGATHFDGFQYWLSYGSSADLVLTDEEISSEIRGGCNLVEFRSLSDINKLIEMYEQQNKAKADAVFEAIGNACTIVNNYGDEYVNLDDLVDYGDKLKRGEV